MRETVDVDHLQHRLLGAHDRGARRSFRGLIQEVEQRVRAIYRTPTEGRLRTTSVLRPGAPKGGHHEPYLGDVDGLREFLARWLGQPAPEGACSRDELVGLLRKTGARVRQRARGHPSASRSLKLVDLVQFMVEWLGRACNHSRERLVGDSGGRVCPDCGRVEVR